MGPQEIFRYMCDDEVKVVILSDTLRISLAFLEEIRYLAIQQTKMLQNTKCEVVLANGSTAKAMSISDGDAFRGQTVSINLIILLNIRESEIPNDMRWAMLPRVLNGILYLRWNG